MTIQESSGPTGHSWDKKELNPKALHGAAQEFEAFLIAQMLRSVRESSAGDSAGSDAASASALGMADDALANALSQRGGLGIARLVESGVKGDSPKVD